MCGNKSPEEVRGSKFILLSKSVSMLKYLFPDVLYMFVDFVFFVFDSKKELKVRARQIIIFPSPKNIFLYFKHFFQTKPGYKITLSKVFKK